MLHLQKIVGMLSSTIWPQSNLVQRT